MSEEVGKHKGAVETLLHEKKELSRLLQIVNSQLERHLSAMEEKGVDTDQFVQQQGNQNQQQNSNSRSANRNEGSKGGQQKGQNSQRKRNRNTSERRKNRSSRGKDDSAEEFLEEDEEDDRDFSPL